MKDLSFFLLKNSLGAKMRKGFKSFCNGDGSTSTLNQRKTIDQGDSSCMATQSLVNSPYLDDPNQPTLTLEEMIFQLELEEKMRRRAKVDDDYGDIQHRMSCVDNSDILRSARNALSQYPRFSLDGKDAMYRSSFRNLNPTAASTRGKNSKCNNTSTGLRKLGMICKDCFDLEAEKTQRSPATLAGERVVWRKPGVVAELMGLEAMPIPILLISAPNNKCKCRKERLSSIIRKQNLRRRTERHEIERRRHVMYTNGSGLRNDTNGF